jgi:hypothetical protein
MGPKFGSAIRRMSLATLAPRFTDGERGEQESRHEAAQIVAGEARILKSVKALAAPLRTAGY